MAKVGAQYLMLMFVFIAPTVVNMNKYVVPTQFVFDTVAVVELDTFFQGFIQASPVDSTKNSIF